MATNIWKDYEDSIDEGQLQKELDDARKNTFEDLPKGVYNVEFTTIEAGLTKDSGKGQRPMLKVCGKVIDGKHKGRLMFMNRVIQGTKNDGRLIASVEGWLAKLEAEDENGDLINPKFKTYSQFADLIMDIAEAVDDMGLTYEVEYDSTAFNSISIKKVLD